MLKFVFFFRGIFYIRYCIRFVRFRVSLGYKDIGVFIAG